MGLKRGSLGVVGVVCLLGVAAASGCSGDNVDSPEDGGAGVSGQGGSSGSAGSSGSGAAGTGGGGTGGRGGSAGMDGGNLNCDPVLDEGQCVACARRNCCAELLACGDERPCIMEEFGCMVRCVTGAVSDGGVADDDTFQQCAGDCASGGTITPATNELFACLITGERTDGGTGADCLVECFEPGDAR